MLVQFLMAPLLSYGGTTASVPSIAGNSLHAQPHIFVIQCCGGVCVLNRKYRRVAGFSLIELLIVIAIILIILAMALPKLNKARMQAFETGAIKAITTIHTAQAQYYSQFGKYATTLLELGPPTSGNANASAADLISSDLANGEKGGYKYTMQATPEGYTVNANPTAFN